MVKFAGQDEASRRTGQVAGTYLREVNFYRHVQPHVAIRTPRCYLAEIDEDAAQFVLALEDLAPAAQGDQIVGCTPQIARAALRELVGLHASSWRNPTIAAFGSTQLTVPDRPRWTMNLYRTGLEHFRARCASGLTSVERDVIERISRSDVFPSEHLEAATPCLVHNDFRLDNFLIGGSGEAPTVHVVDWQTYAVGVPTRDLSYFLGGCLLPDVRRSIERDLVREYHDLLTAAGVEDYSFTECWSDYRRSCFHGLINPMAAMTYVTPTERGDRLFTLMVQRYVGQILDLECDEFLE